jgi:predicted methyltransferase
VRALAREAGFEFVAASDVNANPRDDRDHPFGVWTLPPTLRTSPLGAPDDPDFDTAPYEEIGESDRMTLKFRKPGGEERAPAELRTGED